MLLSVFQIIMGCILLTLGAERFIVGSGALAKRWGMPPLMAGILLVGFGGSFPEIVVSLLASLKGTAGMAVGNAIGSNIVNMGLVLGVACLIAPLAVPRHCIKRDFPMLISLMVLCGGLFWWGGLSRFDGVVLLLLLLVYLIYMITRVGRQHPDDIEYDDIEHDPKVDMPVWRAIVWWVVGLTLLGVSADWVVNGASFIAVHFGISELVIGLSIVAIGTSLPELATVIMSCVKGHHAVALGNVLGSNVFNLLAVLAMPALISPATLGHAVLLRDYPVMVAFSAFPWVVLLIKKKPVLGRVTGGILLLGFVGYLVVVL